MNDAERVSHEGPEAPPVLSDGMELGWVKNWRKKLHSDLWQNKNANRIFDFLLLSATHRPIKRSVGSAVLNLKPGDYISSIRKIAEKCGLTVKETRVALRFLTRTYRIATQNVEQGRAHQATVFSILNWGRYQPETDTKGTAEGTAKGTRRAHQGHKNKKLRSEEEPLVPPEPAEEPPSDHGNEKDPRGVQAFFDLWNSEAKSLPKATKLTDGRKRKIRVRLRERSIEEWGEVFRRMEMSSFLRGETGGTFRADFDWVIKNEENSLKVMEGKYGNREKPKPPTEGNPDLSVRILGYDTVGRPLYATPPPPEVAQ